MDHLILLHGALGSKSMLQPLATAMQAHFQVHSFNFSGHGGEAFSPTPFSIPLFADEIRDFMNAHAIEKAHIFGYSMGGYAALYLAAAHPDMVSSIVTLASKFHWDEATATKEVNMLNADKMKAKLPAFVAELEQRHQPNKWPDVLNAVKELMTGLGVQNALSLDAYAAINTPTMLLLGDRDKMVTLDETLAVYKALPHSQLGVLPGTPHPLEQVNTTLLADLIKGFCGAVR